MIICVCIALWDTAYCVLCTLLYFTFCIVTYCSMLLYSSLNYTLIRNQLWLSRDPFKGFLISQQGFSHFLFWSLCCLTVSTGRNMNQTFRCLSDSARLRTGSKRFSHVRSVSNSEVIRGLIWGQRSIMVAVSLSHSAQLGPNGAAGTEV